MTRTLIYDSSLTGHHPDYLNAVLDLCKSLTDTSSTSPTDSSHINKPGNKPRRLSTPKLDSAFVFMLPSGFCKPQDVTAQYPNIEFRLLSDTELERIESLSAHARSHYELELIRSVVTECAAQGKGIDECVLMYLDYFQAALASTVGRCFPTNVAGVLFQPYTRVEQVALSGPLQPGLLLKAWRKRFRLSMMLRAGRVKRVCVPCDEPAVTALNARHRHRAQFVMLPEPYFKPEADTSSLTAISEPNNKAQRNVSGDNQTEPKQTEYGQNRQPNLREQYGIEPGNQIVLVFGRILPRKNVPRIIEAFTLLEPRLRGGTTLLVMGTAEANYEAELKQLIAQANHTGDPANTPAYNPTSNPTSNPAVKQDAKQTCPQIIYDSDFADDDTMAAAFAQCDVVAMPYLKAWQSSGILFLAARYGKPVLAADAGLVCELVEQHGLGQTVTVTDAAAIASGMQCLLSTPFSVPAAQAFLMRHTPRSHAAVILNRFPL